MKVFDSQTIESTGAFMVGQLEKLDPKLYEPIGEFTWGRDIAVRSDVTIADEVTSFIMSEMAGGFGGTGLGKKSWISTRDTTPSQVALKYKKTMTPVTPWGMEISYSIIELQKAMQVGRPLDAQKFNAMKFKHQLDIDSQVYVGDTEIGVDGMLNHTDVTAENVGVIDPETSTPKQVVDFVNNILNKSWKATAFTRVPQKLLVPPTFFAKLSGVMLTNTAVSLLEYVKRNNLSVSQGGKLEILPCKWLATDADVVGKVFNTDRIVAYTQDYDLIRFPMVELQSLPVQFRDYNQVVPYYGALGGVEIVRPETMFYADLAEAD